MRTRWTALVTILLAVSACATQTIRPQSAVSAVAPQMTVERFLQAANARDLHGMGRLFGTADGDYMENRRRQDVELQMEAISSVLRHEDYRIVREEMVAGRDHPTQRVVVTMTIGGRSVENVPFEVVETNDGRWLVQNVNLAVVMR